jgi:integrase
MKLTTAIARTLEPRNGRIDDLVFDDDCPGLSVRVRIKGKGFSRKWIYQYDFAGRTRRMTLGDVHAIGLEKARKEAGKLQGKVRNAEDPALEKAKRQALAAETFGSVLKIFLEEQKRTTRLRTWIATNFLLGEPCESLYPMSLTAITRREIATVLTPIAASGKKAGHNNVRSKLKTFFNWAIKKGLTEKNPVLGTEKLETKARERVLSMDELVTIWHTVVDIIDHTTVVELMIQTKQRSGDRPHLQYCVSVVEQMTNYADVIHLLMLTACRRSEISELRWREIIEEKTFIDDGFPIAGPAILFPPERVKNDHKFIMPLSTAAQAILLTRQRLPDDASVFQRKINDQAVHARSWSLHKKLLDAALVKRGHKLEHWVLHDIRRSVATHMRRQLRIAKGTVEEVLNHYRANIYIKGELEEEKRNALEAWGKFLMRHVDGNAAEDDGKVVRLQDLRA